MRKIEFVDGWKDVKKQPYKSCLKKIHYLSNVICNKSPTSISYFLQLLTEFCSWEIIQYDSDRFLKINKVP